MTNDNNRVVVRACTGCGMCDYCKERGITAEYVLNRHTPLYRDFARDLDDTLTLIQPGDEPNINNT